MSEYQSEVFKGFLKGVNSSVDRYSQPQGSVPRISNLLMTKRGSFQTCDGSQIIHGFNGVPTANRGRMMAGKLFSPTGVSRYYLAIAKAFDQPLGPPKNLAVATAAGGSLAANTYFYKVTALDNAGGETTPSNEVSIVTGANGKNTLTWNVVPNAQAYNVYRSISTNTELLLVGSATAPLPVPQVVPGTLSVTFVDDGTTAFFASSANAAWSTFLIGGTFFTHVTLTVFFPFKIAAGQPVIVSGFLGGAAFINGNRTVLSVINSTNFIISILGNNGTGTGTSGSVQSGSPPVLDSTQQTALFKMPVIAGSPATLPVSYNDSNIVALFPADPPFVDGGGGGGTGGSGGGGGGGTGGGSTGGGTPSGGVPGNVSLIPEMEQFSNRMAIALGNGFPPQLFADPVTLTNPATVAAITNIAVDAFGVVTITSAAHNLVAAQVGACIFIQGVTNNAYNTNGNGCSAFVVIAIPDGTHLKVVNLNAIGQAASSGGTLTVTTTPFISTFVTAYPTWAAAATVLVGDIVQPGPTNGHFYKCLQGGITGGAQPAFPTTTGQQVADGPVVIWVEAGLTNANAPPPPGAAHLKVYAGSLWVWNTSPTNTTNGLDGPTSLRMCDSSNPNSWNPINQAFIDKDDGTEGSGMSAFTIAGFGIPPEGSLVAFKQISGYQIVGVFGSPNFLIQRTRSSLGCTIPRSIQFTTGFGITRYTHLGFAVFDGMNDRVISEDIRPYLFPTNDQDTSDITVVDTNWSTIAWATQTAQPPMYTCFMPIGTSNGKLTRAFCYDLVLKTFIIVDVPFAISTAFQSFTDTANPVTVLGTYDDGALHRWQASDEDWDNSIDVGSPTPVAWSVETPMVYNKQSQGGRLYCRQVVVRGKLSDPDLDLDTSIAIALKRQGESAVTVNATQYTLGNDGTFALNIPVMEKVTNLDAIISGTGSIELNSWDFQTKPEVATVPARIT